MGISRSSGLEEQESECLDNIFSGDYTVSFSPLLSVIQLLKQDNFLKIIVLNTHKSVFINTNIHPRIHTYRTGTL